MYKIIRKNDNDIQNLVCIGSNGIIEYVYKCLEKL